MEVWMASSRWDFHADDGSLRLIANLQLLYVFLFINCNHMHGAEMKSQSLPLCVCVLFTRLKGLMYAFAWSVHWYSDTGKHGGWKDASLSALKLTVISFLHGWADVE